MGNVIRIDNKRGETHAVLTDTGTGGLFSAGYLRDRPAAAHLEDDETPVFALTNRKRGVEIERADETERIASGSGYRTVAVVTDRRLLVVVGDSDAPSVDGDQCLTTQLVDVDGVDAESGRRDGRLTVTRSNGGALTIHAGADGLDDAVAYLTAASQAWIRVENGLDGVKRSLVTATGHCDAGEYDAALDAAREGYNGLNEPRRTATAFDDEWPADAMVARVDQVQRRCAKMLATVRLGRARRRSDDAKSRWRDGEFESAHDAFDRALEELRTVRTYDSAVVDGAEVRDAVERIERLRTELREAPLRTAVEAERTARETDDPEAAARHWEAAYDAFRDVLELDWGADERRFDGEPDRIRERLCDVVERLVSARRSAATKAKRAGDWYVGAEQYDVAVEEFEAALGQYDLSLAVARDRYADATDHLAVERDAVESRLERAVALRDGEEVGPIEIPNDEREFDAGIGDGETVVGSADGPDTGTTESGSDDAPVSDGPDASASASDIGARLRGMDEAAFTDVVLDVLSETGWTATAASDGEEYDVEATRESPADERMLVRVVHRPDGGTVDPEIVEDAASLRRERPDVDAVMVATSGGVTGEDACRASDDQVRLFDDECLSAIVESRNLEDRLAAPRVQAE